MNEYRILIDCGQSFIKSNCFEIFVYADTPENALSYVKNIIKDDYYIRLIQLEIVHR